MPGRHQGPWPSRLHSSDSLFLSPWAAVGQARRGQARSAWLRNEGELPLVCLFSTSRGTGHNTANGVSAELQERGPSRSLKIVLGAVGSSGVPPTWVKAASPSANQLTQTYIRVWGEWLGGKDLKYIKGEPSGEMWTE